MSDALAGRCGTCGFFLVLETKDDGSRTGECRLGCWPSPLAETSTCSSHKPIGASFEGALKRPKVKGRPGQGRGRHVHDEPPPRPTIPKEIDFDMDTETLRQVIREVVLDELGVRDVEMGDRWHGGEVVLKPGREGVQEKRIPMDTFFKKIVMVRDKLRVLEQKVNAHKGLSEAEKVTLQQYITGCYGSLTTFNVLFREKEEQFSGQSSKG